MKIAIIGHKRIPSNEGGIEKGVEQHAVRMVQRGNDVTVYNRGGHNVFGKEFDGKKLREYKGIKIVTVPTVKGAACVPIYSFLATIHAAFSRYDCVSFRASGSCAMIPLAKFFGLRVVASLHGIDSQRDKWGGFASKYLEFGERMAATKADVCLVLSKNMKQYIDTKYGVDSVLFANGIDKPEKHDADIIKDKYGLEKDSYILSLGRIVPEKGLQYLIKAYKKVAALYPDWKLKIYGQGNRKDELQGLIERENLTTNIRLCGVTHTPFLEMKKAKIFVLSSFYEGFPNVLCEAMHAGLPCVSTKCECGPSELINDGKNGFLVQIGNINQMAEKIIALIENEKLRSSMGEEAERSTERLSREVICQKWRELAYRVSGEVQ